MSLVSGHKCSRLLSQQLCAFVGARGEVHRLCNRPSTLLRTGLWVDLQSIIISKRRADSLNVPEMKLPTIKLG